MGIDVRFRGRSGKAWDFKRVPLDAPWARTAGVALFAAPDTYGWALADAERYGARAVFLATEFDARTRRLIVNDIEAGFSPVCVTDRSRADAAPIAA